MIFLVDFKKKKKTLISFFGVLNVLLVLWVSRNNIIGTRFAGEIYIEDEHQIIDYITVISQTKFVRDVTPTHTDQSSIITGQSHNRYSQVNSIIGVHQLMIT